MSSEQPEDSYEYKDAELSMRIPSYLRPKKGMRFFAARSNKDKHRPLLNMAVEFPDENFTKAIWSTIFNAKPSEWMGVRQRIVRRGKATYLADGLELLSSSNNTTNGDVHDYHVVFLAGRHRVHATFLGQGNLDVFDSLCREIVSGMRVNDEAGLPPGPR
jgi:hypothetical protein